MGACAVVLVHRAFVDAPAYGGVVITQAGNDRNVAALVYVAAFAPDKGESVATLTDPAPGAAESPVTAPQDGFLFQDRAKFPAWFGADIPAEQAQLMADPQVPWGVDALCGTVSEPAWRTKPSWYPVATDDRMIPPPVQRSMAERMGATVVEVAGSHGIYISNPEPVAALVEEAESAVSAMR